MIRRGQHTKRDVDAARRLSKEGLDRQEGRYQLPPRGDAPSKDYFTFPDDPYGIVKIRHLIWIDRGAVVNFVLVIMIREWDNWVDGPRIDCCHGACHVHDSADSPPGVRLKTLDTIEDFRDAHQRAAVEINRLANEIASDRGGS